jgi:hypothetical protein
MNTPIRRQLVHCYRVLTLGLIIVGCSSDQGLFEPLPNLVGNGEYSVQLEPVAAGLTDPLLAIAPSGDPRLFVVEQGGTIRIVADGQTLPDPFLDIQDRVAALLGMAFHPRFDQNGLFYVNYVEPTGSTRVERYSVSANPDRADPSSALTILAIHHPPVAEDPTLGHKGGHLEFGPDGTLYISVGDGSLGQDPLGNAQDTSNLLGALLRIDVDGGTPYAIPNDNPFRDTENARPEIWAYGFRNPWRFTLDGPANRIYIGDVGEQTWEEINIARIWDAGRNFGWNTMEGSSCFNAPACNTAGLTRPVVQWQHDEGCSVIGGYVYRGSTIPGLVGHYVYSDWCGGWLRSFAQTRVGPALEREWDVPALPHVNSLGRDGAGELYVVRVSAGGLVGNGEVLRIVARP